MRATSDVVEVVTVGDCAGADVLTGFFVTLFARGAFVGLDAVVDVATVEVDTEVLVAAIAAITVAVWALMLGTFGRTDRVVGATPSCCVMTNSAPAIRATAPR